MASSHAANGSNHHNVVLLMVPLPAQGHLNQLLHLSLIISSTYPHIPVHYAVSAAHVRQAKQRLHGWDSLPTNVYFHELPMPSVPSVPQEESPALAPTKFPTHLQPPIEAAISHLRHPIATLLRTLSSTTRRLVVINDSLMAYSVCDFTSLDNAESYTFESVSAFSIVCASSSLQHLITGILKPRTPLQSEEDIIPPLKSCMPLQFLELCAAQEEYTKLSSGTLYNTCNAMESHFVDILAKETNTRTWAIGPFIPAIKPGTEQGLQQHGCGRRHMCLEWLDEQPPHSVLYVSFGTTTSMAKEQIDELAAGLEKSGHKFIWVLRCPDRFDDFAMKDEKETNEEKTLILPEGFQERVEGKGMGIVVRNWAPQTAILGHPATGGFMNHCGWNSSVESMALGVPVAAWPMHSDQPSNAVLMAKHLKIGLMVREWSQRHQTVTRWNIEKAVTILMASPEGDEMRSRAAELCTAIRRSSAEGGASQVELHSFIAHISR